MDTIRVEKLELQYINSSLDERNYYEIVADGQVIADISLEDNEPQLVILNPRSTSK